MNLMELNPYESPEEYERVKRSASQHQNADSFWIGVCSMGSVIVGILASLVIGSIWGTEIAFLIAIPMSIIAAILCVRIFAGPSE